MRRRLREHGVQRDDERLRQLLREREHVLAVAAAEDAVLVLEQHDVDVEPPEHPRGADVVAADGLRDRREQRRAAAGATARSRPRRCRRARCRRRRAASRADRPRRCRCRRRAAGMWRRSLCARSASARRAVRARAPVACAGALAGRRGPRSASGTCRSWRSRSRSRTRLRVFFMMSLLAVTPRKRKRRARAGVGTRGRYEHRSRRLSGAAPRFRPKRCEEPREAAPEGRSWLNQASTAVAQRRPSSIAHTISDWPRRASPAANTPGTLVAYSVVSTLPRASRCDAERVEQRRLRADEAHREQHELGRMRLLRAGDRLERRRAAVPQPVDLLDACRCRRDATSRSRTAARRPPSARTTCAASRARAATASARPGGSRGGSPSSSICVTDAAPSRCALATQSAPVSPPPITIDVLARGGELRRGGACDVAIALVEVLHREVHAVAARGPSTGRSRGTREPVQSTVASKPLEIVGLRRRRRSGTRRPRRRAARRAARRRASRS